MCAVLAPTARADINLEFRPDARRVPVDAVVELGVYAVSDDDTDQPFAAIDMAFTWDTEFLELLGHDDTGNIELLFSGFPANDPNGLNEEVPPADGDGQYSAWARFSDPAQATPEGALLTTLQFRALQEVSQTLIEMIHISKNPRDPTVVWDGRIPNNPVTGTIDTARVAVGGCVREPEWQCDGDTDGDGQVNPVDSGLVQAAFGSIELQDLCQFDVDCDGQINPVDSGLIQAMFGTCDPPRDVCP